MVSLSPRGLGGQNPGGCQRGFSLVFSKNDLYHRGMRGMLTWHLSSVGFSVAEYKVRVFDHARIVGKVGFFILPI